MTQEQVNRILAVELDGYEVNTQYFDIPQYTTDWNDFHRVFNLFRGRMSDTQLDIMKALIFFNDTPNEAATRLAQIINDAAIH